MKKRIQEMSKNPVLKIALPLMTIEPIQNAIDKLVNGMPTVQPSSDNTPIPNDIAEKQNARAAIFLNLFGRVYCEIAGEVGFDQADVLIKEWSGFIKEMSDAAIAAESTKYS